MFITETKHLRIRQISYLGLYLLLILVMFLLPMFSIEGYSILQHTTSQLGAQSTPNAFVMNIMFMSLGIGSIIYFWKSSENRIVKLLLVIFGTSLFFTGIFSLQSIDPTLPYNEVHDSLHSLFATLTGFAFCFMSLLYGITSERTFNRFLGISVSLIATGLSISMGLTDTINGVLQRVLFIISFAWILYEGWKIKENRVLKD